MIARYTVGTGARVLRVEVQRRVGWPLVRTDAIVHPVAQAAGSDHALLELAHVDAARPAPSPKTSTSEAEVFEAMQLWLVRSSIGSASRRSPLSQRLPGPSSLQSPSSRQLHHRTSRGCEYRRSGLASRVTAASGGAESCSHPGSAARVWSTRRRCIACRGRSSPRSSVKWVSLPALGELVWPHDATSRARAARTAVARAAHAVSAVVAQSFASSSPCSIRHWPAYIRTCVYRSGTACSALYCSTSSRNRLSWDRMFCKVS